MQAYSLDLRQRIVAACAVPGARQVQVAARFCVSVAFIGKLLRRQRYTGSVAALPGRGGSARYLDAAAQLWLVAQVAQTPDQTLAELRTAWVAAGGRPVCLPVHWRVLDEHGLRRKKSLPATERDSERVRTLRQQQVEALAARADVGRFHLLDETGLRLDYTRRYGRAQGGRRVAGAVPLRRPSRSLTLIGALSGRGLHGVQVLEGGVESAQLRT